MRVELRHVTKTFGPVRANDDVSLVVAAGTIHGLLGENGAGKSTLMKVLSGFISADSGEIILASQRAQFHTPAEALAHGIGMLHQDPLDFPPLTVLDNFLLGEHTNPRGFRNLAGLLTPLHRKAARAQLLHGLRQFDFDLDPEAPVSSLTPGERQQLEIVRLLARGAQTLILDEPTTGISQPQKVKLFATLQQLAAQGKTLIFVSHKLEDVEALCQRVTVLRRGQVVGEVARPFTTQALVQLMFSDMGFGARARSISPNAHTPSIRLRVSDLSVNDHRLKMEGLSLAVQTGEVIGFAGLEGSGQLLVMRACGGLLKPTRGTLKVDEVDLSGQPYQRFLAHGIAYMPAARLDEGLAAGLTLSEHFELARRSRDFTIDWRRTHAWTEAKIKEYNIRGRPESVVEDLSGGNQQRALLALLPDALKLLLLEHPTRGLDIASAQWVWSQLLARREQGTSIIFTSTDLDEILTYSDRIVVFSGGRTFAPINARETTVEVLGNLIGGKRI
jgi:simple sugar transport system ATP-binding protein